jgi:hypothetical protein
MSSESLLYCVEDGLKMKKQAVEARRYPLREARSRDYETLSGQFQSCAMSVQVAIQVFGCDTGVGRGGSRIIWNSLASELEGLPEETGPLCAESKRRANNGHRGDLNKTCSSVVWSFLSRGRPKRRRRPRVYDETAEESKVVRMPRLETPVYTTSGLSSIRI